MQARHQGCVAPDGDLLSVFEHDLFRIPVPIPGQAFFGIMLYGQCQASNAANGSGSGTTSCTACVLKESANAPASDTTVPAITLPPNTSCSGLSRRLK